MSPAPTYLKARKRPVQQRSAATVEAIHTATFQVLIEAGLKGCTTTRVAARAGVSVGSLYQYYPNRDALLAAVLERHLDSLGDTLEQTCHAQAGHPLATMAQALVEAFLHAKLRDPQQSKALYAIASERGGAALAARVHQRMSGAIALLLGSATDARFEQPLFIATVLLNAMVGPVKAVLEGNTPAGFESCLKEQLTVLLGAYLQAASRKPCASLATDPLEGPAQARQPLVDLREVGGGEG
jgi:AcrR family transcriptional regulator